MKNNHCIRHIIFAIIISSLSILISGKIININMVVKNFISIQGTLIGVWATIIGFVLTAVSILLTVKETPFIKALKDTDHYQSLLKVFLDVCYYATICLLFSFLGALIRFHTFYYYIEYFMIILTLIRLIACFYILNIIINDGAKSTDG